MYRRYPAYTEIYRHIAFYFFWGGVYKSDGKEEQLHYLIPLYSILILLLLENNALKWLTERHGCSLKRITYFTETEQRMELLKTRRGE